VVDSFAAVLGVYRLEVADDWVTRSFISLFGNGDDDAAAPYRAAQRDFRTMLADVALVELRVFNRDGPWDVANFAQLKRRHSNESRQEPYLLEYISRRGVRIIANDSDRRDARLAFFMHGWSSDKPLETPYGPIICPAPTRMPLRLRRIMNYRVIE